MDTKLATHTQAVWTIEQHIDSSLITAGKYGFVIAKVNHGGISHFVGNKEEGIANAKLIAAAPDLLNALMEVLALTDLSSGFKGNCKTLTEAEDLAKDVIKKATRPIE